MTKYIVCPGYVRSPDSNQINFVSASTLMHLYGVNPDDCTILQTGVTYPETMMRLHPRADGNYKRIEAPLEPVRRICWPYPKVECFRGICQHCFESTTLKTFDELALMANNLWNVKVVTPKELRDSMTTYGAGRA